MKETKFRAWDYQDKCWTTSNYLLTETQLDLEFGLVNDFFIKDGHEVNRWSIEQCSGKDKNKAEFYEGDILQMEAEHYEFENEDANMDRTYIGEVVLTCSKGACLKNPNYTDNLSDRQSKLSYYLPISGIRSKIIGNIHENPELLKP